MADNKQEELIFSPPFTGEDLEVLKKYFEFYLGYRDTVNDEIRARLQNHAIWGPIMEQITPQQMKAQSHHSLELQRAAIYEGKWKEYAEELMSQGRSYARMNIRYGEWYELVSMAKTLLMSHIKKNYTGPVEDLIDIIQGLSRIGDYAMYCIARAYFLEKNALIHSGEERFRIIFENSNDYIYLTGKNGEVIDINFTNFYRKEDLLGKSVFELQQGENITLMKNAFREAFETKKPVMVETSFTRNERLFYFASSISPVTGSDGSTSSAVVVSRDITRQKEAEIALTKLNSNLERIVAERTDELSNINKELESFTYSVSHDLRAPLRAINGFSAILKEDFADMLSDEARSILDDIIGNVITMGLLIDNLLEFSRLGKKNLSQADIDMQELVTTVAEDFKKNAVKKPLIVIGPLLNVNGDRNMIRQVVINLLSNAIKYSSRVEKPRIEIGSMEENGNIVYFFKDNGAGFNMKYYNKLFGVFQRLHGTSEFEGTGVGLAIVQRIIAKHSGRVWAEGKEGEGAVFYFSLPGRAQ